MRKGIQTFLLKNRFSSIFLVDGIGALITASLLFFVVAPNGSFFGTPETIVHYFALVALVFAVHSLACAPWAKKKSRFLLRIIAIANTLYCAATFSMLISFREQISLWGWIYFLLEILIVLSLARFEWKQSLKSV